MKKDPLPAEFVTYIRRLAADPRVRCRRDIWRFLVVRWGFWLDGVDANALPGYSACPKPTLSGYPAGWSYQKFNAIAREAIGTETVRIARKRAASLSA